jgi:hypothetical protein
MERIYTTIEDVITYEVEPALGKFAEGYDMDAIARECWTLTDGVGYLQNPQYDFWKVAERHAIPGIVFADDKAWDFDAAVNLMDDDIREDLHARGIEDKSTFLWEYIKAHREKFGEEFAI